MIATFLPRLLQSTGNLGSSYKQRSRSQKLWSSAGRSRNSHLVISTDRQGGYESDRFEIIRTVEVESFSESRSANHNAIGHGYDVSAVPHAISSDNAIELKQGGMIFTSAASDSSSGSPAHDADSPFADQRGR